MQHYVKKFDSSGNFIAQHYAYANPADVAVDDSGNVYLTAKQGNGAGTHQVRIHSDFVSNVLAAKIGNAASSCHIYQ